MNEGLIPKRYAKALLELAKERGVSERLYDLMSNIVAAMAAEPTLQKTVANPYVGAADRQQLILTAAGATAQDSLLVDFIKLLEQNKRIGFLQEAALAYIQLYRKANNIYHVEVISAMPLDPQQETRLKKLIEQQLGGATIEYSTAIDPELIGGFVVKIDSQLLDASVANDLKQLRLKLLD